MATKESRRLRVMIVDDVKSARDMLRALLESDDRIEVVAALGNGLEAVEVAPTLRPDLITMDIRLPGLDGFAAVEKIMAAYPVPIVMITASPEGKQRKLFRAFQAGGLDVLNKQELYLWRTRPDIRSGFLRRIHTLAAAGPASRATAPASRRRRIGGRPIAVAGLLPLMVVAIAASTGGPGALMTFFKQIPAAVNACFVVVQHMSRGFLDGLISWLDDETEVKVRKATAGDELAPGLVLFAPEDYHLQIGTEGKVRLNKALPVNGHRPSAEVLFESVARCCGSRAIGVIFTGMGNDGATGLKILRDSGGRTIAQDQETSIVFGMPKAAIELGAAEVVLPLEKIGAQVLQWLEEGCGQAVARE